ncbi:MAG: GH25 family lysozyme [Clostridia bacterium]|nr:GH25 family lysozyme [Clostridia bacterium]MDY5554765.1 GH25 family lysozyme [Blautia sp.]
MMKNKRKPTGWSSVIKLVLGIFIGCLVMFSVPVLANQHYDRRLTVAEEEQQAPAFASAFSSGSESETSTVNKNAWKKIKGVCYNGSGVKIPGAITRGIDVSEWQEKIDWKKVKSAGIDFAFVRVAHGLKHLDTYYDYNMKKAEEAGVPVGTYIYSTATSTKDALKEAQLVIKKMKGYKVSYPVVYDLEYPGAQKLSSTARSKMALTFCNEVRKAGYYPMIYCNTYWYDNYIDWEILSGIDVWIARYGDTIQAPVVSKYEYTIWQATDGNTENGLNSTRGLIPGIPSGNDVDINFGYVDYTKKITPRFNAKSSYVPSSKPDSTENKEPQNQKSGWQTENGNTYYYVNNRKVTGLQKIKEKLYYFNEKTGILYKNEKIITSKGDIYYANSKGVCYNNGFQKIKESGTSHTYYFQKNGKAYKGWLTLNGKKYYFYKGQSKMSGIRAENITLTSSKNVVSVFDKNGVCIKQTTLKK